MSDTALTRIGSPPSGGSARSVRGVVEEFAGALACGALDRIEALLDDDVVVRTPGRSAVAGDHRGRHAAMAALTAAPIGAVRLCGTRVTEILVDGDRGLVVVEMSGSHGPTDFCFEVAFHLAVAADRVVAVTEYSADQYLADRLLGADGGGACVGDDVRPVRRRRERR